MKTSECLVEKSTRRIFVGISEEIRKEIPESIQNVTFDGNRCRTPEERIPKEILGQASEGIFRGILAEIPGGIPEKCFDEVSVGKLQGIASSIFETILFNT